MYRHTPKFVCWGLTLRPIVGVAQPYLLGYHRSLTSLTKSFVLINLLIRIHEYLTNESFWLLEIFHVSHSACVVTTERRTLNERHLNNVCVYEVLVRH